MGGRFSRTISGAVFLCLAFALAGGCQKGRTPPPNYSVAQPDESSALPTTLEVGKHPPADEDPEVVEYIKKKGWEMFRGVMDDRPIVILSIYDRDKPAERISLTADDYRMIARAKTLEALNLRCVHCTDEGIAVIAGIGRLEWICISGDAVTDAGVKVLAGLPKLRTLELAFVTLDGSAFEAFAGSKTLGSVTLEYVDGLTDDGITHLGRLSNLHTLKIRLGLNKAELTTAGIRALVENRLPAQFEFDRELLDDDLLEVLVRKGWLYGPTPPGVSARKPALPEDVPFIVLSGSKVTGRQFFHGSDDDVDDDVWLNTLLEEVEGCMQPDSPMGSLGLQYSEEEDFWEVWIYATPVELVGGRHDGEVVVPGFALDLEQLRESFDSVIAFHWNALGLNYPEGPHVAIEGVFLGREVYLQVLAYAPEGEEPGLKLDSTKRHRNQP